VTQPRSSVLLDRLRDPAPLVTVELRPPRSGLGPLEIMDVWIDLHHAVRRLIHDDRFVFVTDNAVGAHEEENWVRRWICGGWCRSSPASTRSTTASCTPRAPARPAWKR
jgi:hypothetical protein